MTPGAVRIAHWDRIASPLVASGSRVATTDRGGYAGRGRPDRGRCVISCCARRAWSCARTTTRVSHELSRWRTRASTRPRRCRSVPVDRRRARLPRTRRAAALLVASGPRSARSDGRCTSSSGTRARWSGCRGSAPGFACTREVDTGSWLGLPVPGAGIGTEMRAAVAAVRVRPPRRADGALSAFDGQHRARRRVSSGSATAGDGTETAPRGAGRPASTDMSGCVVDADRTFVRAGVDAAGSTGYTEELPRRCSRRDSAEVDAAGERVAVGRVAGR